MDILTNISPVVVEKPADLIICQIKELITSGALKPGDKLPSERKLSEGFGVGRTYVRDAIKKLEFYGILQTLPQSGTVVAGAKHEIKTLESLISELYHHIEAQKVEETKFVMKKHLKNILKPDKKS